MELIVKIAWRNIMRHRGKSLVIGVILFVGSLLMTIGNGVSSGMDRGLRKNIVNGFTGDIVLVSDKQESEQVFLDMMGKPIEAIYNYKTIDSLLRTTDFIAKWLPAGKNAAMVLNEEGGMPGFTYLIGIDFKRYREMFPNMLKPIEGTLSETNEKGILVPTQARKEMFEVTNIWFVPEGKEIDTSTMFPEAKTALKYLVKKDNIVLMGMSTDNTSTDIRLPIKSIFKYNALNTLWGHFALVDIESYRKCLGYFAASDKVVTELSDEDRLLLNGEENDLDALFLNNEAMVRPSSAIKPVAAVQAPLKQQRDTTPETVAVPTDLDDGAYNLVFILLKDHSKLDESLKILNTTLTNSGTGVRAISWKKAIGTIGSMAVIIKRALFIFVMLLFFVAIIIIVNTLSMAALERTSEIGMMRAVGARKGFISTMFLGETAILSSVFGGLGIIVGYIIVKIISLLHITTDNDIVQLLYGGDTFSPFLSFGDIFVAVMQLAFVTVLAVIYPVHVARSITPLDAIARD